MSKTVYELYKENPQNKLSKTFLDEVFDLLIEDELKPYVSDFIVSDQQNDNLGTYNFDTRCIKIFQREIEDNRLFHDMSASLQAIQTIQHELEHARELKRVEEGRYSYPFQQGKCNLASLVSKYALKDYAIQRGIVRPYYEEIDTRYLRYKINKEYQYDPGERLSEIESWKYIVNLIKNQRRTQEVLRARSMLFYSYRRGYRNIGYGIESPTLNFLLNTRMLEDYYFLKKRLEEHDYSFDTRLTYGLPLTQEEYDQKILAKTGLEIRKK